MKYLGFLFLLCFWPFSAFSQTLTGPVESVAPAASPPSNAAQNVAKKPSENSKEPIEITADNTLEWLRGDSRFVARGNAVAVQGPSSVAAQTLTADYREGQGGGIQIHTLKAEQNVVLSSKDSHAYGDVAVYSLDEGLATMTGQNLKMVSPDQSVTARDKFEYWVQEGRVNAIGDAVAVRPKPQGGGEDKLRADKISAVLKDNAQGQRVLDTLEATGNVVITTPAEQATGQYGIYRSATNKAELKGNVVITRGPNVLKGDRAEVDFNTDTSKIFGSAKQGGRVSGTFYPGSK